MIRFDNDPAADAAYKEILRRSVLSRVIHVEINGTELGSEKIIADSLNIKSAVMDEENSRLALSRSWSAVALEESRLPPSPSIQ